MLITANQGVFLSIKKLLLELESKNWSRNSKTEDIRNFCSDLGKIEIDRGRFRFLLFRLRLRLLPHQRRAFIIQLGVLS